VYIEVNTLKAIVLYSSKGGNTEKVAKEIASELNCQIVKIGEDFDSSTVDVNDFDLVFVGTGNYVAKPSAKMLDYLKEMKPKDSKQFALFMTWFGRGRSDEVVFEKMKTAVEANGQKMSKSYYKCQGEGHNAMARLFARLMGHDARGHPNAEDLSAARKWAKELAAVA